MAELGARQALRAGGKVCSGSFAAIWDWLVHQSVLSVKHTAVNKA